LADPKVKEHRGRIVKTTGDDLLVEFASVGDAVLCAVEVQRAMAERNAKVLRVADCAGCVVERKPPTAKCRWSSVRAQARNPQQKLGVVPTSTNAGRGDGCGRVADGERPLLWVWLASFGRGELQRE
jgi:hypothetical protein